MDGFLRELRPQEVIYVKRDDFDLLVDEVIRDRIVTMHFDRRDNRVEKSRFPAGQAVAPVSLNVDRAA